MRANDVSTRVGRGHFSVKRIRFTVENVPQAKKRAGSVQTETAPGA